MENPRELICDYGCGLVAKYQLKNGKRCCSRHWASCPIIRKKNREALSGEKNPMFGMHHSKETKDKISESLMGEKNPNYGKHRPHTAETKKLMSENHKGMSGKHHSVESKQQMSESHIKYLQSSDSDAHCSKSSQEFCWKLHEEAKDRFVEIYFAELNHEHSAYTKRYLYDFVVLDNKKIIEFHGDFWHANPEQYSAEDIIMEGLTAGERWRKDRKKIEAAKSEGFDVLVVWENECQNDSDKVIKQCIDFLQN